ncbi:MAG: ABC transporter substrate binding protein [Caldimonas sp.]
MVFPHRVEIASLAAKQHLPMIFGNTAYIATGGLLMYGANLSAMGRKTWADVQKILRGANASDLPIEQPTEFDFVVNAKAAREQGLEVSPAAMLSATRVVQ